MKKTLATVLVLSLIVALSACSALRATEQKQTSPTAAALQKQRSVQSQTASPATAAPTQPPATTPPTQARQSVTTPPTQAQTISREQAIEIALQAAGLTAEAVYDLEAELDRERGGLYWEVDFETRQTEYSYDIHAYDGTVTRVEKERND